MKLRGLEIVATGQDPARRGQDRHMKLLLDQGLPRSTVQHLQQLGIESVHVGALGLFRATDEQIAAHAQSLGAIVVTLDADFHRIVAQSGAMRPSIIRVRIEGLKGDGLADLLVRVVHQAGDDLEAGALISVVAKDLYRVRRLPIA